MKNKVFLSFKMHDETGKLTRDYYLAKELFNKLCYAKVPTFLVMCPC